MNAALVFGDPFKHVVPREMTRADWRDMTYEQLWALKRQMQLAKNGAGRKFEIRRQEHGSLYHMVETA